MLGFDGFITNEQGATNANGLEEKRRVGAPAGNHNAAGPHHSHHAGHHGTHHRAAHHGGHRAGGHRAAAKH